MNRIVNMAQLAKLQQTVLTHNQENAIARPVEIKISMATCGLAAGAGGVWEIFQRAVEMDKISARLSRTGCMGYCYAEPTIEVTLPGCQPVVFGYLNKRKAADLIAEYIPYGHIPATVTALNQTEDPCRKQIRIALRNCGVIDPEDIEDYIATGGYRALAEAISLDTPDEVIDKIIRSGLRGRGGGGFPTGLKWKITRESVASQKYVVCNADEGDPGAFMDRSILEGDPHSILEAMTINGFCTGASQGLIYIRAEYPLAVERLRTAIGQARERGLLGENILDSGFSFDIHIRYGAGAFVCGEETALIHSMEGKRGEATVKPPFPSVEGYKGYPTNVNNVETYANIPAILLKGAGWFASVGTERSKGTKVFALAGKVKNVGLVEVPMGTTLREVIFEIGGGIKDGKKFKAVQTGGPSGGCLTEKHLDLPIDYDNLTAVGSMMGSGGMIVMDEDDCMVSVAQFYLDFTVEESCGKCAPCRIGNKRLHEMLEKITTGKGTMDDLEKLKNLAYVIKDTALCGLGQTSPNPVLSTLEDFYDEYIAHVQERNCPAHQCSALTQYFINPAICTGCTLCSRACPANAIRGERKSPHVIDPTTCIRCGACLDKCKYGAVSPLNPPKGDLKERELKIKQR